MISCRQSICPSRHALCGYWAAELPTGSTTGASRWIRCLAGSTGQHVQGSLEDVFGVGQLP